MHKQANAVYCNINSLEGFILGEEQVLVQVPQFFVLHFSYNLFPVTF